MFYKEDYMPEDKKFIDDNPNEFAAALAHKTKKIPSYRTGFLVGTDAQGIDHSLKPIVYEENSFFAPEGMRAINNRYYVLKLHKKYPDMVSYKIVEGDISSCPINKKVLAQMSRILQDFFVFEGQQTLKDKNNNKYTAKIVSNADTTIGAEVVVDMLYLYKGNDLIGYLSAKYTTPDIMAKISKEKKSHFFNIATIDYSSVDEEYQNTGLGYAMYFAMSKHLTAKNIAFRKSTLQSDLAQRLWVGIEKHWRENIEKHEVHGTEHTFLKITDNNQMTFKQGKPVIKMKL